MDVGVNNLTEEAAIQLVQTAQTLGVPFYGKLLYRTFLNKCPVCHKGVFTNEARFFGDFTYYHELCWVAFKHPNELKAYTDESKTYDGLTKQIKRHLAWDKQEMLENNSSKKPKEKHGHENNGKVSNVIRDDMPLVFRAAETVKQRVGSCPYCHDP